MTFPGNKEIIKLFSQNYIFRSYHFLEEPTSKLSESLEYCSSCTKSYLGLLRDWLSSV